MDAEDREGLVMMTAPSLVNLVSGPLEAGCDARYSGERARTSS